MENDSVEIKQNESKKRRGFELDLTSGNLFLKMPLFALPLALTTTLQLLYTTIDLWTVSTYGGGNNSMSAIGSNSSLINLIITVLVSLATGSNVLIAVAKGENNKEKASKILHTSFLIAIIGGILVGLIGYFISKYLLIMMNTPTSIFSNANTYLQIYFIGLPFLMIYNFGSQMMRALGDSKKPFIILLVSGIINVIFDIIFVKYLNMDVLGVAIATVMSEAVSALMTILFFIFNKRGFVSLKLKEFKIDMLSLKEILKIGLPAGVQGLAFSIPNVLIQSSLYTIPSYQIDGRTITQDEIVAGSSASQQIENYMFAFIDAFAISLCSFVGQNYGSKNIKNIKKAYWYCTIWMMIFSVIFMIICGLLPYQLLSIFITNSSSASETSGALISGKDRLYIMVFTYFLDGIMDIDGNYMRGMKRSTTPAIITLIGCTGTRILFLYTIFNLETFHTVFWLYSTYPISWVLVSLIFIPFILKEQKDVFLQLENKYEYKLLTSHLSI